MANILILQEDITTLKVDAIVNATNNSLCGGGGVDGAIHKAAGPELLTECRTLGGCDTGFAKMTQRYHLPAKYIIHTVGPVWYGGHKNEEQLLSSCYRECMQIVIEHKLESIAFPAISCGAYRFPIDKACSIALSEINHLSSKLNIDIFMVCFEQKIRKTYEKYLKEIAK